MCEASVDLISSHCSTHFFSPFLSVCVLFPHFLLTPKGKEKGSLSHKIFGFSLQAAEREAEHITGHMGPCGGALMTGWEGKSLLWSLGVNSCDNMIYSQNNADGKHKQGCTHAEVFVRYRKAEAGAQQCSHPSSSTLRLRPNTDPKPKSG